MLLEEKAPARNAVTLLQTRKIEDGARTAATIHASNFQLFKLFRMKKSSGCWEGRKIIKV